MATTPSWLSCLKPHISWVFRQLGHFNFSGPGATAFVLSQEGDIRPPFFEVWEGRTYGPCNPGRSWGFTPNPTTFEKVDETFTFLSQTQARACEPAALSQLRRPKAACAT